MCRTIKILILNGPRTRKFSQLLRAGKTVAFEFSHHGPIFVLWLVKISQVSSCGKFRQHLETCLLLQLKLTESVWTCDVFKLPFFAGCTKWNSSAIKSLLLFMASLFIGFLVEKYVACQSRKSDFGWHRFRFSPCLIPKRVEKSQAILGLLDSFQELHLEW